MGDSDIVIGRPGARDHRRDVALFALLVLIAGALAAWTGSSPAEGAPAPPACGAGQQSEQVALPDGGSQTFCYGAGSEVGPGITLTKTVGTNKNECAATDALVVTTATEVVYCYRALNTGDTTLTTHDLDDSRLGSLLSGFAYDLGPGASVIQTRSAMILGTTENIATWTASDGISSVSSTASATVTLAQEADAPTGLTVTGTTRSSASLSWTAPSFNGLSPVTSYQILVYIADSPTASIAVNTGSTATTRTITGLTAGTAYRFSVAATNDVGTGNPSGATTHVVPPFRTTGLFTTQQYLDFNGAAPTASQLSAWRTELTSGSASGAELINDAVDFPYWAKQSPVIRLYQAYFKRLPDTAGLNYWVGQYRSGVSLNDISQKFARSREFKDTYGSLTNKQFVELVYQNVLGRPGEASGVAFWTGELDSGRRTRGRVMTGFSESPEYKTKTKAFTDVVNVYTGMLRRVPTKVELALWQPQLAGGTPRTTLIQAILTSADYDARIPA